MNPLDIFDKVLLSTKYLDKYKEEVDEDLMRIENIRELRSVASDFKNLADFLDNVSLVQNKTMPNLKVADKQDAVTFMTLHASKGLEFEVVFMVGVEEGLFPHSRSLMEKEEMEEERRLCYVGITRAKKQLFLSHAKNRLYFGQRSSSMISRFISEIPEKVKGSFLVEIDEDNDAMLSKLLSDELDIDDFLDL
jgi:DNA helicase-2/ATP-dependent DNA helicase PcrA